MRNIGIISDARVGMIIDECCEYPNHEYHYSPSEHYPEYPYEEISPYPNSAYDKIRRLFHTLNLDENHYGLPEWNPLGDFIRPGDRVLIKPNFVMHYNKNKEGGTDCLVTHPSLIRAVLDYVLIAEKGQGSVFIGDAPMAECDFNALMREKHYNAIWDFYNKLEISILPIDFRNSTLVDNDRVARNDAMTGILVDVGESSALEELSDKQMKNFVMVLGSYPNNIKNFHARGVHKYLINKYIIESDVIIGMPKVKTHRKAGMTACSKNFVGACAIKDCLPHSIYGGKKVGGSEYPDSNIFTAAYSRLKKWQFKHSINNEKTRNLRRLLSKLSKKYAPGNIVNWDGAWYGNDVVWRFIVDLNRIMVYSDPNGIMRDKKQRIVFNICDAIVAGQKNGPLSPAPKELGAVLGGFCGIAIDYFIAKIMRFDYQRIRYIPALLNEFCVDPDDISVCINDSPRVPLNQFEIPAAWSFIPSDGWKDYIEQMH